MPRLGLTITHGMGPAPSVHKGIATESGSGVGVRSIPSSSAKSPNVICPAAVVIVILPELKLSDASVEKQGVAELIEQANNAECSASSNKRKGPKSPFISRQGSGPVVASHSGMPTVAAREKYCAMENTWSLVKMPIRAPSSSKTTHGAVSPLSLQAGRVRSARVKRSSFERNTVTM